MTGCISQDEVDGIQLNQLVGYLPQPTLEPQRYVVRVTQLPNHESAPRHAAGRAKGLIIAASGEDQSFVGKGTWIFLENCECLLGEDWDGWLRQEIPREAHAAYAHAAYVGKHKL